MCCLCRLFEYYGFLCSHALTVLEILGISTIPSDYILKRWTRKYRVQRLDNLFKLAIKLSEEGSSSGEAYQGAVSALEEALKHCVGMNNSVNSFLETNGTAARGIYGSIVKESKRKRVSKKRKVQSEDETLSFGIQESSQDVLNQRSHSHQESYISQQDRQGMGNSNSLTSLHDCYYSGQTIMQGILGNLNAVSARVSNHTAQYNLQGMGQFSFGASSVEGCFQLRDSLHNLQETSVNRTSKHLHD